MKTPSDSELPILVKRRKTLLLAAAVGVAGCNLAGPQVSVPAPAQPAPGKTAANEMVQNYTSDIEKALDNIDRKRLSLAKQAGQNATVEVAKVSPEGTGAHGSA